ncbi:MAG TPA: hypothetical protein PLH19_01620 [Anaerolineae bacterium]|nr:hypothetical protein [Anaerolineae bacterium]HQH37222.1 hypothetical protein [Anaerolineae bacterium]
MKSIVHVFVALVIVLTLAASIGTSSRTRPTAAASVPPIPQVENTATNLLIDGNMEMQPYPWYYPNHYVAPYWKRLWYYYSVMPEYDDTRTARVHYEGLHAQVYFKWGPAYQAGIYQVVTGLTQCTPYELSAYGRNHSVEGALPHARVGLDPEGTQLTPGDDGGFFSFPSYMAWSAEQTQLFVWEKLTVQAEPIGDRLTAILYASPQPPSGPQQPYYDTYWDAAELVQTTFPNNRLPAPSTWSPSDFIYAVQTTTSTDSLTIQWKTQSPASTQVRYEIVPYQAPISSTILISLTYRTYLPVVAKSPNPSTFTRYTELNTTPIIDHQAVIGGIQAGDTVIFVPLSRRPTSSGCTTETYTPVIVKFR